MSGSFELYQKRKTMKTLMTSLVAIFIFGSVLANHKGPAYKVAAPSVKYKSEPTTAVVQPKEANGPLYKNHNIHNWIADLPKVAVTHDKPDLKGPMYKNSRPGQ